jgi:hypothetical protein
MNEAQVEAMAMAIYACIYQPMERSNRTFATLGPQQQHDLRSKAALVIAWLANRANDDGTFRLDGHGVRRSC